MSERENKAKIKGLIGIGLDNKDGHKRLTRAPNFAVVGGSEETHDKMTETLLKTFEELKRRGKELEDAEKKEISELIHKHTPEI